MPKSPAQAQNTKRSTRAPSTPPKRALKRRRETTPSDLALGHRLDAALDGIDAILIAFDRRGHCTHLNRKAEHWLGEKREKLLGCPVRQKFPKLIHATIPVLFRRALKTGKAVVIEEFCPRRQVWLEISLRPSPNEVWACLRDVTELRRIEKQLASVMLRNQQLESIEPLITRVAHDLNNILAPILLAAPLLGHDLAPGEKDKIVDLIHTSAQRGTDMARQLSALTRAK